MGYISDRREDIYNQIRERIYQVGERVHMIRSKRGTTYLVSDLDGRGVQGKQSSRSDPVVAVIG